MKKKWIMPLGIIVAFVVIVICIYPSIEFYKGGYLYMMSYGKDWEYSEDFDEVEQELCISERHSYNKKRDITITSWEYNKFFVFKWFKIKYEKGNLCATEYQLEESYIKHFIEEAKIDENKDDVDLAKLIKGKRAIVSNKRYPWNEERKYIGYTLDGKYQDMYIGEDEDGLLIIQVGHSDEGPRYIAYK